MIAVKVYILAAAYRGLYDGITAVYLSKTEADKALKHLGRRVGNTENFIEECEVTETTEDVSMQKAITDKW